MGLSIWTVTYVVFKLKLCTFRNGKFQDSKMKAVTRLPGEWLQAKHSEYIWKQRLQRWKKRSAWLRDYATEERTELLPPLPNEIVLDLLWPRLFIGLEREDKVKLMLKMRHVSKLWLTLVDDSDQFHGHMLYLCNALDEEELSWAPGRMRTWPRRYGRTFSGRLVG
jgi:hypothetical protein